jgi:hypothetical protein
LTTRVLRQPADPYIQLLIGDCVHNLRQALDHLAYALAISVHQADPPPNQHCTEWPIRNTPIALERGIANYVGAKKRMPAGMYAAIDGLQPYKGGNRELLTLLHALDNRDKHRFLPVIAGTAEVPALRLSATGNVNVNDSIFAQSFQGSGVIQLGAFYDGSVIVRADQIRAADGDVYMNVNVTPSIAFGETFDAAPGRLVLPVLASIGDLIHAEVFPALDRFL